MGRAFESIMHRFYFLSFVEFYSCIFGANVIDFEIFKTVLVIVFKNPVILGNIARCPIQP